MDDARDGIGIVEDRAAPEGRDRGLVVLVRPRPLNVPVDVAGDDGRAVELGRVHVEVELAALLGKPLPERRVEAHVRGEGDPGLAPGHLDDYRDRGRPVPGRGLDGPDGEAGVGVDRDVLISLVEGPRAEVVEVLRLDPLAVRLIEEEHPRPAAVGADDHLRLPRRGLAAVRVDNAEHLRLAAARTDSLHAVLSPGADDYGLDELAVGHVDNAQQIVRERPLDGRLRGDVYLLVDRLGGEEPQLPARPHVVAEVQEHLGEPPLVVLVAVGGDEALQVVEDIGAEGGEGAGAAVEQVPGGLARRDDEGRALPPCGEVARVADHADVYTVGALGQRRLPSLPVWRMRMRAIGSGGGPA